MKILLILIKNIFLFVITIIGICIFIPFTFVYACFKFLIKLKFLKLLEYVSETIFKIAVSLDQLCNLVGGEFLNDVMIKDKTLVYNGDDLIKIQEIKLQRFKSVLFGFEDETMSSCFGKSYKLNNLRGFGKTIDKGLGTIENNHSINSIGQ